MISSLQKNKKGLSINLVSFDVPYPPNYGGVIDVFFKLKALNELGVEITLHTFEYGRGEQEELNKYCKKIFYYKRKNFYKSFCSSLPFVVKTRGNDLLKERLINSKLPVVFEGLHTTHLLYKRVLQDVKTIVRMHNVEHLYYNGLAKSEKNNFKKMFFKLEGQKLKKYESVLQHADHILSLSLLEQDYFFDNYGVKAQYIPVFSDMDFEELAEEENFVLWHGDLRVTDNEKSALQAIDILKNTNYKLIVASSFKLNTVLTMCNQYENIVFNDLKKKDALEKLLKTAKVNLLFTFQPTGIKLKLLKALVKSRFVMVNSLMLEGTNLQELCVVANSEFEVKRELEKLMNTQFSDEERNERKEKMRFFNPKINAQKIVDIISQ